MKDNKVLCHKLGRNFLIAAIQLLRTSNFGKYLQIQGQVKSSECVPLRTNTTEQLLLESSRV